MTEHALDPVTQKIVDDFDVLAKRRAIELLAKSDREGLSTLRESAFCLGYKAGVVDLGPRMRQLEAIFAAACAWRDSSGGPDALAGKIPDVHVERLIAAVDAARGVDRLSAPLVATATEKIDVRHVVNLTQSVASAFKNYVDGSGLDAKQLAAVVPTLLDSHVHLEALRRAGYGVEEICRLDAEVDKLRAELARVTKLPIETQVSISVWAEATFGPAGSNARAIARANREMAELLEHVTSDDRHPEAAEEIADIVIVLSRVMTRLGADLQGEIDRKMATNRARKWRLDGTGHGYHVEEPESEGPKEPEEPEAEGEAR